MTGPLKALRRLLGRGVQQYAPDSERRGSNHDVVEDAETAPDRAEERDARSAVPSPAVRRPKWREAAEPAARGEGDDGSRPSRLGRMATEYLSARAEEMLGILLREMTAEVTLELENSSRAIATEVASVREGVESSKRELSRIGREMLRSGATLESVQAAVSGVGPAMERLEASLREGLEREQLAESQIREEARRAALDDMLAALDGLDAGMEYGRELVQSLAEAHRRLKDATVQRWWRAMGEATGIKRPLPEVPYAEVEGWMGGLELTHRRLQDALARRGVMPIDAVGKPFDPHLHEAVGVEPCPEDQDGLVLREERRGYRTAERIVRLAQVVVGKAAPPKAGGRRRRSSRTVDHRAEDREDGAEKEVERTERQEGGSGGEIPPERERE